MSDQEPIVVTLSEVQFGRICEALDEAISNSVPKINGEHMDPLFRARHAEFKDAREVLWQASPMRKAWQKWADENPNADYPPTKEYRL